MFKNNFDITSVLNGVEYRVAQTPEDKEKVYETVYNAYLKKGYISKNVQQMNLFSHSWLPESKSFLALSNGQIMTTATVIPDSPFGLPMDELFKLIFEAHWEKEPYCFLNPWADQNMITGNATIGLEILEDMPDVETVYVPGGGGGLISGIASALKLLKPSIRILGVH